MFKSITKRNKKNSRQQKSLSVSRTAMTIEKMEDRKMFAADLPLAELSHSIEPQFDQFVPLFTASANLGEDGNLSVYGTLQDDVIRIEEVDPLVLTTVGKASPSNVSVADFGRFTVGGTFNPGLTVTEAQIKVTITDKLDGDVLLTKSYPKADVSYITVSARSGDDNVLNYTDVASTQYGGTGNDLLRGGESADIIYGNNGDDNIQGRAGNDTLYGQNGEDNIYGNDGADRMYGGDDADTMYGHNGNDIMSGGSGNDYMNGGRDNDWMDGDSGNDTMTGDTGNDTIYGDTGNDLLNGSSGNDSLHGNDGEDTLNGGSGNDSMYGGNHDDTLNGSSGNDYMSGGNGNDDMNGGSGNDRMYGGNGNDEMNGGSGNDFMSGGNGNDTLRGSSGEDELYGGHGRDNLYGGSSSDYLSGGSGDDGLYGGSGSDDLRGGSGDDRFLVLNDQPVKVLGFTVGWDSLDDILDKSNIDAKINFRHGEGDTFNFSGGRWAEIQDGTFTPSEIEQVDESLAFLHHQVGNTKLLKRKGGGEITIQRLGAQTDGNFSVGGINSGGSLITVLDATFAGSQENLNRIMFHEVGHNWDDENDNWDDWKDISNWTGFLWPWESTAGLTGSTDGDWWHDSSATFARNYGRTNPMEDFATYFAKVMMEDNGMTYNGGSGGGTSAAKEQFMDDFFASLA